MGLLKETVAGMTDAVLNKIDNISLDRKSATCISSTLNMIQFQHTDLTAACNKFIRGEAGNTYDACLELPEHTREMLVSCISLSSIIREHDARLLISHAIDRTESELRTKYIPTSSVEDASEIGNYIITSQVMSPLVDRIAASISVRKHHKQTAKKIQITRDYLIVQTEQIERVATEIAKAYRKNIDPGPSSVVRHLTADTMVDAGVDRDFAMETVNFAGTTSRDHIKYLLKNNRKPKQIGLLISREFRHLVLSTMTTRMLPVH